MTDLAAVAAETRALVAAGTYTSSRGTVVSLRADVDAAVQSTTLLREAALDALVASKAAPPPGTAASSSRARVQCWDERSGACAQRLLANGARKVAVLNYANGVNPGGGFVEGARAQEEDLCRCSALYACLTSPAARAYYVENRAAKSAFVLGSVLVSRDVPVFRNEGDYAFLDAPYRVTMLTAAAPSLGWLTATVSNGEEPASRFAEVPAVFARRTRFVLAAAHAAGCDAVVAGPWGCGAFGNDPDVVASAFVDALAQYADVFGDVVFATWGPGKNRDAFERRFA